MKTGLFIGRFQPFHNGHYTVIRRAFNYVDELKIAIGSAQFSKMKGNPWTYEERRKMITKTLKSSSKWKNIRIFRLNDIGDPYTWPEYVRSKVGKFDILFSGNIEGVVNCFKKANIENKPDVIFFTDTEPYHGIDIREDMYDGGIRWSNMVPPGTMEVIMKSKSHWRFV